MATSLVLSHIGILPQLGELLRRFFVHVGLWVLPAIVFIEYLYGLNFSFPGAFTILFAMAATQGDASAAFRVFLIIWLMSVLGLYVSYQLGRRLFRFSGDSTTHARQRLGSKVWAFVTYCHPLTASIRSFQCGVHGSSNKEYLLELIPSNFIWNCFWAYVSYTYGQVIFDGDTFAYILLLYAGYWAYSETRGVALNEQGRTP